jgi:hypothetical protein
MRDGDSPSFHGALQVDVASLVGDLSPSIGPQSGKDVPTVHDRQDYNAHEYT